MWLGSWRKIIWTEEANPSAIEELLFDDHNADESDEREVDKYFGDNCMNGKYDWNSSEICFIVLFGPLLFVFDILGI